jgi:4-amino-4-deoxy-L-arabinose transferase-like glycosyltransferase
MRYLFLFVFSLLITVPGISRLPPVDRDEARFVQATKQMVASGDYIDIRFQDEHRYKKPVGIYWLQSAAVELTGFGADAPIWVYRLVSVLGIALSVLATCWTGSRMFGRDAGFIAGLVMAGIFAAAFEGRIAKTDATLLAFSIIAQGALAQIYLAAQRNEPAGNGFMPWLFWIAQGCGILIKGPITPLLSLLTIAALYAWDRDWRWLARLKPARGIVLTALIVLPWLVLITWKSGGAFFAESVGKDLLGKVGKGGESHGAPPGYYALTYSLYMWPFGLLAVGAGLQALNAIRLDARLRFCLAWYIPFWLVFELIPTKLPHYVLVAYPGVALMIGWAMTVSQDQAGLPFRTWQTWLWRFTAFGLIAVTLGMAVLAIGAPIYLTGAVSPWSIPAALFTLAAGYLAFPRDMRMTTPRIAAAAATAGVAYALMFSFVLPSLTPAWLSPRIAAALEANRPCPTSVLASVRFQEPSLVFLVGTDTKLTDTDGAAQFLLSDPACAMALIPAQRDAAFKSLLSSAGKTPLALATIDGINYSGGDRLSLTLYRITQ